MAELRDARALTSSRSTSRYRSKGTEKDALALDSEELPTGGILIPVDAARWSADNFYRLGRAKTTIGRAAHCNVRINHPSVSRLQAELTWSGGALTLTHLSAANPTFVNGVPVAQFSALVTGDLIELGEGIVLRVELFAADEAPTAPRQIEIRRMYAVVHGDVVGYSKLVEADATATAKRLEQRFELIRQHTASAGGRLETQGDSLLCLHTTTALAVDSALAWQQEIALLNRTLPEPQRMLFRVGIHSGDILISPIGNAYGEAINIATRVQALALPGAVFVTGTVRDQLQARENIRFTMIGDETLKNISHEVRVYRADLVA